MSRCNQAKKEESMATDQAATTQAIAQAEVEATKAAVQSMAGVAGESSCGVRSESISMDPYPN